MELTRFLVERLPNKFSISNNIDQFRKCSDLWTDCSLPTEVESFAHVLFDKYHGIDFVCAISYLMNINAISFLVLNIQIIYDFIFLNTTITLIEVKNIQNISQIRRRGFFQEV